MLLFYLALLLQGFTMASINDFIFCSGLAKRPSATSFSSCNPTFRPCEEHIALRQTFSSHPFDTLFAVRNTFIAKITRFWARVMSQMKGAMSHVLKILCGSDACCSAVSLRLVWKCVAAMNSTSSAQPSPKFCSGSDSRPTSSLKRGSAVEYIQILKL